MMEFLRDKHERQFQLAFNRGAIRGDIIYSICLAVFGLSTAYRLRGTPDAGSALLATSLVLAYAPLLLLLSALWPALYVRHRQPLVTAMKIWAAFVSTLLPQVVAAAGAAPSRQPAAATLAHAGSGLASQLVLHALGLQTTGAWLILSQGFAVAVSACLAARACDARLTSVVRRLLHERPGLLSRPWLLGAAATGAADPGVVCKAFTLGMQIVVGYCATTALALLAEWRQRRAFAAKLGAEPPCSWSLAAVAGCYLSMLCLLLRIALATVLAPAAVYGPPEAGACAAAAGRVSGTCAAP